MKTKKILSLMLCLLMLMSIVSVSASAADTRIEVSEFVGTSNFVAPSYGEKVKTYYTFTFTKGYEAYIADLMGQWLKWNETSSKWEVFTSSNFVAGKYKYENQIRIDGTYGTTHKLAQTANVTINGEKWSYSNNPAIYNTFSFTHIASPEYTIKKPAEKVNSIAITNLDIPVGGATPDTTATTEATFKIGSMAGIVWYRLENDSWQSMSNSECFEAGKTYKCYFQVLPTDGYIFPDSKTDFSVTINGETATIGNYFSKLVYIEKEYSVPCIIHNYVTVDSKDPKCTEDGYTYYECTACGNTKSVTIPATDHTFSLVSDTATCETMGEATYKCNSCSASYKKVTPPKGHNYVETGYKDSTCGEDGYTEYECTICGETKKDKIPATGAHTKDGSKCTTCGYDAADDCDCNCHAGGIKAFFFKLINFFAKLFNPAKRVCECGAKH